MKVIDIDHNFQNIVIAGTGKALPPLMFTNEDMVAWHGHKDPDWIFEKIGVRSRHSFYDYFNNKTLGLDEDDLAVKASRDALADAGMTIKEIDAIFFTTSTPTHHLFPDSACTLHGNLGASMDTPAMTLSSGCCGTLNGFMMAISLIKAGQAKNVLVCGASSMTSFFQPHLKEKVWLHSCIFGDGVASIREAAKKLHGDRFGETSMRWISIGGPVKAVELAGGMRTATVYGGSGSLRSHVIRHSQQDGVGLAAR